MATNKTQFISRTTDVIVQLAVLHEMITGLAGVFTARGYATAGTDKITDQDLLNAGSNLTELQFNTLVVPLLGDYLAFCDNKPVTTKDRKTSMNIARKDV